MSSYRIHKPPEIHQPTYNQYNQYRSCVFETTSDVLLFSQAPGGRPQVAMLACIGYIVPEYFRWPGDLAPAVFERTVGNAGFAGC
jgi:hypothetical protein